MCSLGAWPLGGITLLLFSLPAAAQVQIEGDFLPCSFSILEEQPMDMLLGLDMLKRHQVGSGGTSHRSGALWQNGQWAPLVGGTIWSVPCRRSPSLPFPAPGSNSPWPGARLWVLPGANPMPLAFSPSAPSILRGTCW